MPERRSLAATLSELLAYLALMAVVVGAVGGRFELMPGVPAFRIFGVGLIAGVVVLIVAVVGLLRTRVASGRTGRRSAAIGAVVGGGLSLALVVLLSPGLGLPTINDITTDVEDPPRFEALAREPANRGRDLAYPGDSFAAQQRLGYPDLGSLRVDRPPEEAYADVVAAAEALGWTLVAREPERLRLEAYEETDFFHFVDDVVVRVRPAPGGSGSVVDVRSKSREGKGDLGANAARIRRFFDQLQR